MNNTLSLILNIQINFKIDTYSFINLKKNKSMRTHMLILTNNEKLTLHI